MKSKINDTHWISAASVISCFAVVFLHTNGCFWKFSSEKYWMTANIIESVFYFAVPVFFMISGATLIDYTQRYSTETFFRKRIKKTLVPFIAWSVIGLGYKLALGDMQLSDITTQYVWNGIVETTIVPIYWFFPVLFSIYLSVPLFAAVNKEHRRSVYSFVTIASFVLGGVLPLLTKTILKGYIWNLNISVAAGYLMFPLIGYLVSKYDIQKIERIVIYTLSIAGLFIHMFGTYSLSIRAGEIVTTFKGYTNAPCIMYSVGIFVWLKYNSAWLFKHKAFKNMVKWISPYTLSIYLMQYFIYTTLVRYFDLPTTSIVYRLGMPWVVVIFSIICTAIIRKIPYIRALVP